MCTCCFQWWPGCSNALWFLMLFREIFKHFKFSEGLERELFIHPPKKFQSTRVLERNREKLRGRLHKSESSLQSAYFASPSCESSLANQGGIYVRRVTCLFIFWRHPGLQTCEQQHAIAKAPQNARFSCRSRSFLTRLLSPAEESPPPVADRFFRFLPIPPFFQLTLTMTAVNPATPTHSVHPDSPVSALYRTQAADHGEGRKGPLTRGSNQARGLGQNTENFSISKHRPRCRSHYTRVVNKRSKVNKKAIA